LKKILEVLHLVVDDRTNQDLIRKVTKDDVKRFFFSMGAIKTSGLDGFPMMFFQEFLEVIKYDLVHVMRDFNRTNKIIRDLKKTFIVLVPKINDPTQLEDFRSISLCNTIYKIFSKVMVNRMKPILNTTISLTKNGFFLVRKILDTMITSHEVLHSMEISVNPAMVIKLDMF